MAVFELADFAGREPWEPGRAFGFVVPVLAGVVGVPCDEPVGVPDSRPTSRSLNTTPAASAARATAATAIASRRVLLGRVVEGSGRAAGAASGMSRGSGTGPATTIVLSSLGGGYDGNGGLLTRFARDLRRGHKDQFRTDRLGVDVVHGFLPGSLVKVDISMHLHYGCAHSGRRSRGRVERLCVIGPSDAARCSSPRVFGGVTQRLARSSTIIVNGTSV